MSLGKEEKDDSVMDFFGSSKYCYAEFSLCPILVGFEFSSWIDLAVKKSS